VSAGKSTTHPVAESAKRVGPVTTVAWQRSTATLRFEDSFRMWGVLFEASEEAFATGGAFSQQYGHHLADGPDRGGWRDLERGEYGEGSGGGDHARDRHADRV